MNKIIKKYKMLVYAVIIVFLIIVIIGVPRIFAELQPVKSIEIYSEKLNYKEKEPGSWKITKSAKWINQKEAEITIDVDSILKVEEKSTDMIFVLDTSGSMEGERLDMLKSTTTSLADKLLSDENNRVALITFDQGSSIVSEFTNEKDTFIDKVNSLTAQWVTNYYQALVNVDRLMKNYIKEDNRECVVVFLTDGYPNYDTPNEVGEYNYLKKTYPYLLINAIQYEMGNEVTEEVKRISDNQYVANVNNLESILNEASVVPMVYESFNIEDFIDTNYFYIESKNDLKVDFGNVIFDKEKQKITWFLDNLRTGKSTTLKIKVKLKKGIIEELLPTNEGENITSVLGKFSDQVESKLTPVLKGKYDVIYDTNAPNECHNAISPEAEKHSVFETVEVSSEEPVCEGYHFKGWKYVSKSVERINDDYFIMPEEDVKIKGTWSKLGVSKSMDGTVKESLTLYKQVAEDFKDSSKYVKKYTGDTSTFNGNEDVYYYYGPASNNNVIFANYCWKIVRTTDTGGVKLLYNGEPDSDGKCGADREEHVGYGNRTSQPLSSNYLYGTEYTYDKISKQFTLSGAMENATWNATTYPDLIGKYTCKDTIGHCSTIYQVLEYNNNTSAFVLPINSTTKYSEIGTSAFNDSAASLSDVGYMYNKRYPYKSRGLTTNIKVLDYSPISADYYYADEVKWNNPITNKYNLIDPHKLDTITDYSSLVGKYTFRNTVDTYTTNTVFYIVGVSGSNMYYIRLSNGEDLSTADTAFTFADSVIDDGTGKYNLDSTSTKTVKHSEWFDSYADYKNKYYQNTNGDIYYVTASDNASFKQVNITDNYMYGNSFTYNEETEEYTLSGVTQHLVHNPNNYYNELRNKHYTCWNTSGICKTLSYIYGDVLGSSPHYIDLEKGTSIEKALQEMLSSDDVNTTNSRIKNIIDDWYLKNMIQYTDYLEDTVWCNSRRIKELNAWNPNGGVIAEELKFWSLSNGDNLTCPDKVDSFTTDEKNGNGALRYPVGLITSAEAKLASPLSSAAGNWLLSPTRYRNYLYGAAGSAVGPSGSLEEYYSGVTSFFGIRPSISLRAGTEYSSGDGSIDYPFVIITD